MKKQNLKIKMITGKRTLGETVDKLVEDIVQSKLDDIKNEFERRD